MVPTMRVPIIIRHRPIRRMGTNSKRSIIHTETSTTRIQVSAVDPHKTLCRQHLTFSCAYRRAPESSWQRFQPLGSSSITDDARIVVIVIVFIIITWLQLNSARRHGSAAALLSVECSRRQQFQFTTTFALDSRHYCTGLIIWLLGHLLLIPRYVFIGLRPMITITSLLGHCVYMNPDQITFNKIPPFLYKPIDCFYVNVPLFLQWRCFKRNEICGSSGVQMIVLFWSDRDFFGFCGINQQQLEAIRQGKVNSLKEAELLY